MSWLQSHPWIWKSNHEVCTPEHSAFTISPMRIQINEESWCPDISIRFIAVPLIRLLIKLETCENYFYIFIKIR